MKKIDLLASTPIKLNATLKALSLPSFVGKQIAEWVFKKYKTSFDDMHNISKANRAVLDQNFRILSFLNIQKYPSASNDAVKYVFECSDHHPIESVLIKGKLANTLCVSTQIGCPLKCQFCLTGNYGFVRNLTVAEIVGQLLAVQSDQQVVSRVVFMGMGEPLLNLENVLGAIQVFNDQEKFNIGRRKMTVSTVGILSSIQYLIDQKILIELSLSIGSADLSKRQRMMPVEKKNPLSQVLVLLKDYSKLHNRLYTLEYTLIQDQNDQDQDIAALINCAKYLGAKINLINLNPHPRIPFEPVSAARLTQIQTIISDAGVPVTIRYSRGKDIGAACGQLGECLFEQKDG